MALILITPGLKRNGDMEYYELNRDYAAAVTRAGGLPVIGPYAKTDEEAEQWAACADGLLLSGGGDVDPSVYAEENRYSDGIDTERDLSEKLLLRAFMKLKKPVLGICRGVQIINAVMGGTLYQDIAAEVPGALTHPRSDIPRDGAHKDTVRGDTLLHRVFGQSEISVNSRHHQAVKKAAPGMTVCCVSEDGIIEGTEMATEAYPFLLGIQWHPESMAEKHPEMQKVFDAFVTAAKGESK